jgi:hypothetical protein
VGVDADDPRRMRRIPRPRARGAARGVNRAALPAGSKRSITTVDRPLPIGAAVPCLDLVCGNRSCPNGMCLYASPSERDKL